MKTKGGTEKLNKVVFFNMLGPVLLNGISFFTIPIFTRLLGTENYGIYTIYSSFQNILLILMSVQTYGAIGPSSVYYEGKERDRFFSNAVMISLASSLLFAILILLLIGPVTRFTELPASLIALMLVHSVGMFGVNFAVQKFAYDKKAVLNFAVSTGVSVASVLLSLLFICVVFPKAPSYLTYITGHVLPYALAGIPLILYFLFKGKSFFRAEDWRFCLSLCLPLIFHAIGNTVLHQSDKIMIQKLIDENAAGVYGFAVTFANVIWIIWNALNVTWVPFYHDDIKSGNMEQLRKKTVGYLFLFTSLTIGFVMAMPEVVKVFASEDFWDSISVIPILALGFYFVFLYSFPVNFEFYLKQTRLIAVGTCASAIINIGLNFVLIKLCGMMGAAIATCLSYALLYLFHSVISRFLIKEDYHYSFKEFHLFTLIACAGIGLFYLIQNLAWLRWSIFAVLAAALLVRTIRNRSIF